MLREWNLSLVVDIGCLATERGSLQNGVRNRYRLALPPHPSPDDLLPHQAQLPTLFLELLLLLLLYLRSTGVSGLSVWFYFGRASLRLDTARRERWYQGPPCQDALHPADFASSLLSCIGGWPTLGDES